MDTNEPDVVDDGGSMLASNTDSLTAKQLAHIRTFDQRTNKPKSVDLERYEQNRFGAWNPYWYVYDNVKRAFSDSCSKLLLVGCGNGLDALTFAYLGYDVYAFDISPKAIAIATDLSTQCQLSDRTHFTVQAAESLNYQANFFDLVVGVNVLHHVDIRCALQEVHRVLRPGGRAIFKEPLLTPRWDRIRNSRIITAMLPKGIKSKPKGTRYELIEGEKNLDKRDLDFISNNFANCTIRHWHVLAKLSALIGHRPLLERIDWAVFKVLPFFRQLGDQAVLVFEKPLDAPK